MAIETWQVRRKRISGTQQNPETIPFSALTDISGVSLPDTFDSAPQVCVVGAYQDRGANPVDGQTTTTQFKIALSNDGDLLAPNNYVDLEITGEEA